MVRFLSSRRPRRRVAMLAALVTALATAVIGITLTAGPALAAGTGSGYLHTSGNKIVDSSGATVRLTGINWFGMETDNHTFHGLWAGRNATWKMQIDHMATIGFNTIRVPYTGISLAAGTTATSINSDSNPDLVGLSPMGILDLVVNYAGSKGMRIILDRHRPTTSRQTPLWNGDGVSEASLIADWRFLAQHYAGNTTVIGADLFNEPHADGTDPQGTGAAWGSGTSNDWRLAAERMGNAVLAVNPNWLIFVEGVSCNLPSGGTPNPYDSIPDDPNACDWWGGNLSLAGQFPVRLNVANRLVYSPHDYGLSVYHSGACDPGQPWFGDPSFPANLPAVWDRYWGYLFKQNIAPIMLGEFGSTLACAKDTQWLTSLMAYLGTGVNGMSFTYWSWNPDSGDTGGIVLDDWVTEQTAKLNIIRSYLIPPVGGGSTSGPTSVPTTTRAPTSAAPTSSRPPTSVPPSSSRPPSSSVPPSSSRPPTSTVPTTGGQGGGACAATLVVTSSWQGGWQGEVTVKAGNAAINGWTATWTLASGQTISQLWQGALTTSGSTATVKNLSYNGTVAANATTSFGFLASGAASVPTITCTSP